MSARPCDRWVRVRPRLGSGLRLGLRVRVRARLRLRFGWGGVRTCDRWPRWITPKPAVALNLAQLVARVSQSRFSLHQHNPCTGQGVSVGSVKRASKSRAHEISVLRLASGHLPCQSCPPEDVRGFAATLTMDDRWTGLLLRSSSNRDPERAREGAKPQQWNSCHVSIVFTCKGSMLDEDRRT